MTQDSADSTDPDSSESDQTAGEKPSDGDGAAGEDQQRFHRRGLEHAEVLDPHTVPKRATVSRSWSA